MTPRPFARRLLVALAIGALLAAIAWQCAHPYVWTPPAFGWWTR
jgi:hypothetical protein